MQSCASPLRWKVGTNPSDTQSAIKWDCGRWYQQQQPYKLTPYWLACVGTATDRLIYGGLFTAATLTLRSVEFAVQRPHLILCMWICGSFDLPNALAALFRLNQLVYQSVCESSQSVSTYSVNTDFKDVVRNVIQPCHTKRVERSTDRNPPPIGLGLFTKRATKVVPGGVVTYCFWWKSERRMSAKSEVELIFTLLLKIALMSNISKTVTDTTMGSMEVEYESTHGLPIGTLDDLEQS